jgi:hypothetical protein
MNIYVYTFFHFGSKTKKILKFLKLRWENKCQAILYYFGTTHHQTLGHVGNRKMPIKFLELSTLRAADLKKNRHLLKIA